MKKSMRTDNQEVSMWKGRCMADSLLNKNLMSENDLMCCSCTFIQLRYNWWKLKAFWLWNMCLKYELHKIWQFL